MTGSDSDSDHKPRKATLIESKPSSSSCSSQKATSAPVSAHGHKRRRLEEPDTSSTYGRYMPGNTTLLVPVTTSSSDESEYPDVKKGCASETSKTGLTTTPSKIVQYNPSRRPRAFMEMTSDTIPFGELLIQSGDDSSEESDSEEEWDSEESDTEESE